MARVFFCATALLASFCFVVPRPEHPRFRVTPLRHWKTDGQYKQKAPPTASALCLSLILVTGVFTRARQTWNNRRVPPPKCGLRSTENHSMLLMAEARRLRAEVAKLETEQLRAKEQIMACGGLELVKCSQCTRSVPWAEAHLLQSGALAGVRWLEDLRASGSGIRAC